jgi:hypothetical protein
LDFVRSQGKFCKSFETIKDIYQYFISFLNVILDRVVRKVSLGFQKVFLFFTSKCVKKYVSVYLNSENFPIFELSSLCHNHFRSPSRSTHTLITFIRLKENFFVESLLCNPSKWKIFLNGIFS